MVQAPPRIVFNPSGREHSDSGSSIVSVAPQLPYYVEVRTGSLISFLLLIYNCTNRSAVQRWLEIRQRTGFYFEISEHLHIAFADQRDGKSTPYWWFIYYDNVTRGKVLENIKLQENSVNTKIANRLASEELLWNGLTFRSKTEIRIAKVLASQSITFFANVNGFIGLNGLPVSNHDNKQIEKAEVDFFSVLQSKMYDS